MLLLSDRFCGSCISQQTCVPHVVLHALLLWTAETAAKTGNQGLLQLKEGETPQSVAALHACHSELAAMSPACMHACFVSSELSTAINQDSMHCRLLQGCTILP